MSNELALISDGKGLAVIGNSDEVDRFLAAEGLSSRKLGLERLGSAFGAAAGVAQAGSEIATNSGRWVKLTKESAEAMKKYGLMKSKTPGVSHAMLGKTGSIKKWLQIDKGPGAILSNPANLAGAAGIMAQVAMQQQMAEITEYLQTIDEKLDDVLRAQKDAVLAEMIGTAFIIDEAMSIREQVGRVSEVNWSKVQHTAATIASTQAYALRQLDALAEKMERKSKVGDLAEMAEEAEQKCEEWLAVLAYCFRLLEGVGVLELDRVLDASPSELDRHRLGLESARQKRRAEIALCTERLVDRMNEAARAANAKVLFNPVQSPAVVKSTKQVVAAVTELHARLEIESANLESLEARLWTAALGDARDKAFDSVGDGVGAAKRLGSQGLDLGKSVGSKLGGRVRRNADKPAPDERD